MGGGGEKPTGPFFLPQGKNTTSLGKKPKVPFLPMGEETDRYTGSCYGLYVPL